MNLKSSRLCVFIGSSVTAMLLTTGYALSQHQNLQALKSQIAESQSQSVAVAATSAVSSEDDAQSTNDDALPKVRQAARDFIQENKPGVKSEGVFTLALRADSLYIAGVDVSEGNQHRTIDLLVRQYVKKNGGQYWRAESLGAERAAALMDKANADPITDASAE